MILGRAEMMKDPVYQLGQLRGVSCSRPSGKELRGCHWKMATTEKRVQRRLRVKDKLQSKLAPE